MSRHQLFRRVAVEQQIAQHLETVTFPAPTRGIILNENETYMQPGAALIMDNWAPTMRGCKLRGGHELWAQLPETTPVISSFEYVSATGLGAYKMFACNASKIYDVSAAPVLVKSGQTSGNHVASQFANQGGEWLIVVNDAGDPPLRYNGTDWEVLINGYAPPAGKPSTIDVDLVKYPGAKVDGGANLVYVCKYREHLFFIEKNSMNAWYLPINAVGGNLEMIPLSGAANRGGKLLFCAVWSIDAGDGADDKLVFCTDLGELLIFTGSNPADAANWRQEGRYEMSPPMGMNAHILVGGDLLIATIDGIMPTSGAINKDRAELELAAITRPIKSMWREEALAKRAFPWTMCKWDEFGGMFVTWPGGKPGKQLCAVVNQATGAWCRFTGWDATCFMKMRGDLFFGTQTGQIMQADRTGYDNGRPYTAVLVGGWEVFQSPSQTATWRQARASFSARNGEPFQPQLSACVDYVITLPPPPNAGPDTEPFDVWDQGVWGPGVSLFDPLWVPSHAYTVGNKAYDALTHDNWQCAVAHSSPATGTFEAYRTANPTHWTLSATQPTPSPVPTAPQRAAYAQWDQGEPSKPTIRNTGWVSIGITGFSHAPVVQITVGQRSKPLVELISIAATFEREGVVV